MIKLFELINEFDVTEYAILKVMKTNGLKLYKVKEQSGYLTFTLNAVDENTASFLRAYYFKLEQEKEKKEKENRKKKSLIELPANIEQLRKEHPLVKDDRFFCEWFFPDVSI